MAELSPRLFTLSHCPPRR